MDKKILNLLEKNKPKIKEVPQLTKDERELLEAENDLNEEEDTPDKDDAQDDSVENNISPPIEPKVDLTQAELIKRLRLDLQTAKQIVIKNFPYDPPEVLEDRILKARRRVIHVHYSIGKFIQENYPQELKGNRNDRYPLEWMTKDPSINANIMKYKPLIPILNYLFNLNRYKDSKDENAEIIDSIIGDKIFISDTGKQSSYAAFLTNAIFYNDLKHKLKCEKITIQKYLQELKRVEIIKFLGKNGRNGEVWSDGYYAKNQNSIYVKKPFLSKARHLKGLRNFAPKFNKTDN